MLAPSPSLALPDPAPVIAALQAMLVSGRTFWRPPPALDPMTGCDCHGVIWWAFHLAGIALPEDTALAATLFHVIPPPYQPFDVLLARPIPPWQDRHVGVFMGPRWGFHCSKSTNGLARFSLDKSSWRWLMEHGLRYQGFLAPEDRR